MIDLPSAEHVAQVVVRGLAAGESVEIDGLGVFHPDAARGFRFEPCARPKVFLAYVKEDAALVERLYDDFAAEGFSPWMDSRKLMAGQNWPRAIETAIEGSDFFIACFSSKSASKRGGFQSEIRYALDCARRIPLDEIYMVPVRLDACRVPRSIQRELQYIDLFPDWTRGVGRLTAMMRHELARRR